ncbi:hypothetical protein PMI30_05049 [Pseudomonas sp. GM50]|nr:hypothetical protein PMI30_05049 [Pseudomonas sp. GM50]
MGEPHFRIKHKLKRHGIVAFSSNYSLYGDMSERVMSVIESLVLAVGFMASMRHSQIWRACQMILSHSDGGSVPRITGALVSRSASVTSFER